MVRTLCKVRGLDAFGSGEYRASRGSRVHNGIDYVAHVDSTILSPVNGRVTKLGYPYGDDLSFRYVQITDYDDNDWRIFYVFPEVIMGQDILVDDLIGSVQDLGKRYKGITSHIHLEIKNKLGNFIDPRSVG